MPLLIHWQNAERGEPQARLTAVIHGAAAGSSQAGGSGALGNPLPSVTNSRHTRLDTTAHPQSCAGPLLTGDVTAMQFKRPPPGGYLPRYESVVPSLQ